MKLRRLLAALLVLVLVITSSPIVYASATGEDAGQNGSADVGGEAGQEGSGEEGQTDPTGSGEENPIAPIADAEVQTLSAIDTSYMLWSAAVKATGSYLERKSDNNQYYRQTIIDDEPYIDSLLTDAVGEFNKSGEEWTWIAYKVSVPTAGEYTLGMSVTNSGQTSYKIPLCVNNAVHTLTYSAKNQDQTTKVPLPAGEHTVVVFMPMPQNAESASGTGWVDYTWICVDSMTVDYALTASKPTVAEVEACFQTTINAGNESFVLANKFTDNGDTLGSANTDSIRGDYPVISELPYSAHMISRWPFASVKVTAAKDGNYKIRLNAEAASGYDAKKLGVLVDGEVHSIELANFGAVAIDVQMDLTAGEHVVTFFTPMATETNTNWANYPWMNYISFLFSKGLTISKPTIDEIKAHLSATYSANDANYVLPSAAVWDKGSGYLEFNNRDAVKADLPYIDSLYSDAAGEFNKPGEEWGWFAYKVNASVAGTYTLGVRTQNCGYPPYKIPICVNNEVYVLNYAATGKQSATVEVTLPAGNHVVVMFMPMPQNASEYDGAGKEYIDYPWCNVQSMIVDSALTVAGTTVEEVEACFGRRINAGDQTLVLANQFTDNGDTLGGAVLNSIREDLPTTESLSSSKHLIDRWPFASVKVTVAEAGNYNITLHAGVNTGAAANHIGMLVDGKSYGVQYNKTGTTQASVSAYMEAGEHVITFFSPMPKDNSTSFEGNWSYYPWVNFNTIEFGPGIISVEKPTMDEVKAPLNSRIAAVNADYMLWSATVDKKFEGAHVLYCANQSYVRADMPHIDTLISDAWDEFNASGSEWNWFAYKVDAPAAGTYTLGVKVNNCKFASYTIPLYVDNEVYTLTYSATNQEVSTEVTLSAGEHVVVMFMPMPQNAATSQNNVWNDYPWCNVEAMTVDTRLELLTKPTAAEVESYFSSYTKVNPGDAKVVLFNKFTDMGDTLADAARTEIQADMPTVESLPYSGNLIGNWPFISMKVTAAQEGDYTIRLNVEIKSDTASKQVGMLLDGVSYGAPIKIQSGSIATVTTSVHLTAGDHVLTFFIPMPMNGASNTNNIWIDYPWINYNSILLESGLTVSKPEISEVTATLGNRVEAENTEYAIYNNYNTPNEANAKASGGMVVGGAWTSTYEQTFEELELWLDAKHNAYVEYAVVAPADGEYEIGVGFLAGSSNKTIAKPYIAVIVNDTTYKAQFTKDWNQVERVPLTVSLKEGLNIIRCTSMTTEQEIYGVKGWINQDFIDLDNRLTPVKHSSVSLEAENAKYVNKYKVQAEGKDEYASADKVLGSADRKYITGQKLTLDTFLYGQLKQVPYFSVTVNAPMDGYYPVHVGMSGDGRLPIGTVGMLVDDVVHTVTYSRTSKSTAGARVDALVYLTAGQHVLTFTSPMPASADLNANYAYYWSNYDYITLYDGLTFAANQQAPIPDPDYTRIEVEDYALFNLSGNNGHAAGNAVYNVSQSVAEIMKNGIDGTKTPYIELKVNAKEAGPYAIFLGTTYGINEGGIWEEVYGQFVVDVNGKLETKTVQIHKSTASTVVLVWIILEEGENTVRLTHLTSDAQHGGTTWIDFDYIEMPYWVTKGIEFVKPGERLEAEDSNFDGFAEEAGSGFSGGACLGRVNYDTVEDLAITFDALDPADMAGLPHVAYRVFTEKAGTYSLAVGFKAGLTNYSTEEKAEGVNASFAVIVNGETKQRVEFIIKGDKSMARIINVDLKEGENEIIVTGATSEYVIDRNPRNDETYRLVWINQDYLALPADLTSMSMNEDLTNIDDSDIDFGQLNAKERSEQDAADNSAVEPAEAESGFGWIWIVAGIGAAFILFLILLIGKKRKKEEEA